MGIYVALEQTSYVIPSWVDTTRLTSLADQEWTEKNDKDYIFADENILGNNNLSFTTPEKSTATFTSKVSHNSEYDYYYNSAVSFALVGDDKTSFNYNYSYGRGKWKESAKYSIGSATKNDLTDDVSFTSTISGSYQSGTYSEVADVTYKDGLGTNIKYKNSYSEKDSKYTDTYILSYSDATNIKINAAVTDVGTIDEEYVATSTSISLGAGSFSSLNDSGALISVSWTKRALNAEEELSTDIFSSLLGYGEDSEFSIADVISFASQYAYAGANTITIKSTAAQTASVDGGAGNDKITGGAGNDSITGGAGKDTMTGGGGDDTFYLSFDDYDFTSNKTLLADTITGFKYTNSERDSVVLEGFGSIEAYATINDAKAAESTVNVIYEAKTGKFWYNEDGDAKLVGVMNFATVKGIPLTYFDEV
jgi:Ca2+-binding RTX toxin-like protein